MKKLLSITLLLTIITLFSCSKDEDEILFQDKDMIGTWENVIISDNDTSSITTYRFKQDYKIELTSDVRSLEDIRIYTGTWSLNLNTIQTNFDTTISVNRNINDSVTISEQTKFDSPYRIIDYDNVFWNGILFTRMK